MFSPRPGSDTCYTHRVQDNDRAAAEVLGRLHDTSAGAHLDRCGAGVRGVVITVREPANVAGVADHHRGDDRADTEEFGERGARLVDRGRETLLRGAHLLVEAAQVLEMLDANAWRARSTGVVGATDVEQPLRRCSALISLGIPPATSSANSAWSRHAVRFRARPRSLLRFA